jgi:hypothetical protein
LARADPRRGVLEEFAHRARLTARAPGLDAAAREACDALTAAGVDALLLKGRSVARMLYRPGEHRGYFDVDLLAAPSDLASAGAVLAALGYVNVSEMQGVDDVAGILHEQHWSRLVPGFGNVSIDLHWRLPGCEARPDAVWSALSRHRVTIELGGGRVPALDRAGLAVHLALHAAQHGAGDAKALGDLGRALSRWPYDTWEQATRLAGELQALGMFAAGLRLLVAGVGRADELGLPHAEEELWQIAHRDDRPRGVFHLTAFCDAAGARERARIVRRALLPKRAWIVREHPWAATGRYRLFTAYLMHVLRAPAWAARAWRFRRRAPR